MASYISLENPQWISMDILQELLTTIFSQILWIPCREWRIGEVDVLAHDAQTRTFGHSVAAAISLYINDTYAQMKVTKQPIGV